MSHVLYTLYIDNLLVCLEVSITRTVQGESLKQKSYVSPSNALWLTLLWNNEMTAAMTSFATKWLKCNFCSIDSPFYSSDHDKHLIHTPELYLWTSGLHTKIAVILKPCYNTLGDGNYSNNSTVYDPYYRCC